MTALERDPLFFAFLHYEDKELITRCLKHKTDSSLWPIKGSSSFEEDTALGVARNIHTMVQSHRIREWITLPVEKLHSFKKKLVQLQRKFLKYPSRDLQESIDIITRACQDQMAHEQTLFLDPGIIDDLKEIYGEEAVEKCVKEVLSGFPKTCSGKKELNLQALYLACNQSLRENLTESFGPVFEQFCKTFKEINLRFDSSKVFSKEELIDLRSRLLVFQENQLKLSELERSFGQEVWQEYFPDHFSQLQIFYSCEQAPSEVALKEIIKDLDFQKELSELRHSLIEAKGRKTHISPILSKFRRLTLKYPDREKITQIEVICYGLDCLIRDACFLQSDVEKIICDRIPTCLSIADEQEIAKAASQSLCECFITRNLRNLDLTSLISDLKEKAFQDRLKIRKISIEAHKPEISTILWTQQLEEVTRNLCREKVNEIIENYDRQSCGQFSLLISRYKGYSPEIIQEYLFSAWRESILKFLQSPSVRFTTISPDAITAEERRIKAFISRAKLIYTYIFNHMQHIRIPHDQNDPSLNIMEGTCFANSLERHLKLLQDPSTLSEELPMDSSFRGRKLYATVYITDSKVTSKKSAEFYGSMFLKQYELQLLPDSKYTFLSTDDLLKTGLDILASRQVPALLLFGSHIINIQYDPKRLIFRIIDDNIGCLVCNTEIEFQALLQDHISEFSEGGSSSLIIPTK